MSQSRIHLDKLRDRTLESALSYLERSGAKSESIATFTVPLSDGTLYCDLLPSHSVLKNKLFELFSPLKKAAMDAIPPQFAVCSPIQAFCMKSEKPIPGLACYARDAGGGCSYKAVGISEGKLVDLDQAILSIDPQFFLKHPLWTLLDPGT